LVSKNHWQSQMVFDGKPKISIIPIVNIWI